MALGVSLCLLQRNGEISSSPLSMSYARCAAGYYAVDLLCIACQVGRFSQNVGGEPCIEWWAGSACYCCCSCRSSAEPWLVCSPVGTFTNHTGTVECTRCPAGQVGLATFDRERCCSRLPSWCFLVLLHSSNARRASHAASSAQWARHHRNQVGLRSLTALDLTNRWFSWLTGALICSECQAGRYAPGNGTADCLPCPVGQQQPKTAAVR